MSEKFFTFTEESFTKEEIQILHKHKIYLQKNDIGGDVYFSTYLPSVYCDSIHCWNINVMRDVITFLQNNPEPTQKEIYNIYGRKTKIQGYECDYNSVRFHYTHRKTGKPSYAKLAFSEISEREIIAENDEYYTQYYIGTGEMTDGRTVKKYLYKNKNKVKEIALNTLDKQIESAIAYKKLIEND